MSSVASAAGLSSSGKAKLLAVPSAEVKRRRPRLYAGQQVQYYSNNLDEWLEAKVVKVNRDGTCDVEGPVFRKRGALAERLRPVPSSSSSSSSLRRVTEESEPTVFSDGRKTEDSTGSVEITVAPVEIPVPHKKVLTPPPGLSIPPPAPPGLEQEQSRRRYPRRDDRSRTPKLTNVGYGDLYPKAQPIQMGIGYGDLYPQTNGGDGKRIVLELNRLL